MVIIGVDFGTTNSICSYYDGECIHIIPNENGDLTTSSSIGFNIDSNDILFGNIPSKNYTIISNFKRLIGVKYSQFISNKQLVEFFKLKNIEVVCSIVNEYCSFKILFNGIHQTIDIDELTIKYIEYLLKCTRNVINFTSVVITVPVYYNDTQRSILKEYFARLDLNVVRVINEPTAAALAYSLGIKDSLYEKILVVDSGGGTTDFSILEMDYDSQIYRVVDVIGDNFLGGEDITKLLSNFISNQSNLTDNSVNKESERIKRILSFRDNTEIYIEKCNYHSKISRLKFENICNEFFGKFKFLLENFVKHHNDIDKIVFVGGTTRIPKIISLCSNLLPKSSINNTIDPDHTVSIGASVQGYLLDNLFHSNSETKDDILLLDVVSMSLGVESDSGLMNVIIPKNTTIPVQNTMYFTNEKDFMSEIEILIYQGERKLIKYNTLLTTLKLSGLDESLLEGKMKIKIQFTVDADGILKVVAHEMNTDVSSQIHLDKLDQGSSSTEVDLDILFDDIFIANQILSRNTLYKTFKELLIKFREKEYSKDSFELKMTNKLFNETFDIISKYSDYSPDELNSINEQFRIDFHNIHIIDSFDDF
jgi:molecular chaperone DnaK (HSP70)